MGAVSGIVILVLTVVVVMFKVHKSKSKINTTPQPRDIEKEATHSTVSVTDSREITDNIIKINDLLIEKEIAKGGLQLLVYLPFRICNYIQRKMEIYYWY